MAAQISNLPLLEAGFGVSSLEQPPTSGSRKRCAVAAIGIASLVLVAGATGYSIGRRGSATERFTVEASRLSSVDIPISSVPTNVNSPGNKEIFKEIDTLHSLILDLDTRTATNLNNLEAEISTVKMSLDQSGGICVFCSTCGGSWPHGATATAVSQHHSNKSYYEHASGSRLGIRKNNLAPGATGCPSPLETVSERECHDLMLSVGGNTWYTYDAPNIFHNVPCGCSIYMSGTVQNPKYEFRYNRDECSNIHKLFTDTVYPICKGGSPGASSEAGVGVAFGEKCTGQASETNSTKSLCCV